MCEKKNNRKFYFVPVAPLEVEDHKTTQSILNAGFTISSYYENVWEPRWVSILSVRVFELPV